MYKNKLQELAQRSCFNLPSYACMREGPDHAPRFKASVNFNGETYESPSYCSTLRQAEHSAAEVALNALASGGPTSSLAARILDETGVYKNLLQEVSQRVGGCMPSYTTFRSGQVHLPIFTCTVELVGVIFTGDPAKSKKQAEKNAAMVAWLSLKSLTQQSETFSEKTHMDEQEHVMVARALQEYLIKAKLSRFSFPIKFPAISPRPSSVHHSSPTTSKILPLICPKTASRSSRPTLTATSNNNQSLQKVPKFPAASAPPYIPVRHCIPHSRVAPLVNVRSMVPVFSAPPLVMRPPAIGIAQPVSVRHAVPVYAAAPVCKELPMVQPVVRANGQQVSRLPTAKVEELPFAGAPPVPISEVPARQVGVPSSEVFTVQVERVAKFSGPPGSPRAAGDKNRIAVHDKLQESREIEDLKNLKI
ncbi:Double-stranded RNA-binding protein 2 [Striga hermonthica]|uniref:Double-stranded RNA-binding protein 2 n=1 Tax=Striga hermonthica TaxID=68872 RepID=A0A9N7NYD4_STRHE|nr:Double-stranded RNA-binding protein 2 [Striga hermonthica]